MPEANPAARPKIVFAGSPEFAASILSDLINGSLTPVAVFTQPDRPQGRGRKLQANPVKRLAQHFNLPVEQPASLKGDAATALLASYQPDILVVAAYGLILPQPVLDLPGFACLNVHASLLPRWRGAAPIERAAIAGDKETGVCIMHMQAGLDSGPVYQARTIPIDYDGSITELEQQLAALGSRALQEVVEQLVQARVENKAPPVAEPQDDTLATYAEKLTAADRHLNWQRPALDLRRQIWALSERLPVRAMLADTGVQLLAANTIEQTPLQLNNAEAGTIVDITRQGITVQCATDLLQIKKLKVEKGKGSVLDAAAAINGYPTLFRTGSRFAPIFSPTSSPTEPNLAERG